MKLFVTSSKDTTIYTSDKTQNTGNDQILDLFKIISNGVTKSSRILIQFDYVTLETMVNSGFVTEPTYSLSLKTTKFLETPVEYDIEVLPVSSSWVEGIGKRHDDPITTEGVSYSWRDREGGTAWNTDGGDFITSISSSYHINKYTVDVDIDITDMINDHISGSYDNNGFIVKFTDSEETDDNEYGFTNFFASDTHTIYKPKLSVEWFDSVINSGSLDKIEDNQFVTIKNLKREYKVDNKYEFNIHTRELYPKLTFTTGSVYSDNNYLPEKSYYSIVDAVTDDTIVSFSNNSKLSMDDVGSYFEQDFTGWVAERYYKIVFKTVDDSGNVNFIDNNFTFKLIE